LTRLAADPTAAEARHAAERILAERRFHGRHIPDPLANVFSWIGDLLTGLGNAITDWINSLASGVPGGSDLVVLIGAGLVLALSAFLAARSLRRRTAAASDASGGDGRAAPGARHDDWRSLERAADEAERAGDYESAVRLRFRAGLLRLDERGAVTVTAATTTREVARALRSSEFDRVAAGFDRVAYGGRAPAATDADLQRAGWKQVLATVGGKR
jgi:hypothetical protein